MHHPLGTITPHDRIRSHTAEHINADIQQRIYDSIECHRSASREVIERRLRELDKEWDVDRAVTLNFALLAGSALYAGVFGNRKWLNLPLVQMPFLVMHMTMGWCPPLPVFRAMRFRTRHEIEAEASGLRALLADNDAAGEVAVERTDSHVKKSSAHDGQPAVRTLH